MTNDPVLAAAIRDAENDPDTFAVVRHGSRARPRAPRPPFHDRLRGTLGAREPRLLALLREPDVGAQLAIFTDVRALMESHGAATGTKASRTFHRR